MSDIRANTISDAAGTGPIDLYKQSAAKAWVTVDASSGTPTIIDSFNISTVSDIAVGKHQSNYINSFSNVGYTTAVTPGQGGSKIAQYDSTSTTSEQIRTQNLSGTDGDYDHMSVCNHGDLA